MLLRPPLAELDPIPERGRPRRRHRQALNMKVGAPLGGQPPRDKEYQSAGRKNQSEHTPKSAISMSLRSAVVAKTA